MQFVKTRPSEYLVVGENEEIKKRMVPLADLLVRALKSVESNSYQQKKPHDFLGQSLALHCEATLFIR